MRYGKSLCGSWQLLYRCIFFSKWCYLGDFYIMSNALTENLKKINYEKYASLIALVVLFIISSFLSPYFLQFQNILNILIQPQPGD